MKKVKVIKVDGYGIKFDNDCYLTSEHQQDCCESHELTFSDLTLADFEGLEFNLTNGNFFKRIPDYGIELVPIKGHTVKIPGHGYNNGYYGTNIEMIIWRPDNTVYKSYDVTECQQIDD